MHASDNSMLRPAENRAHARTPRRRAPPSNATGTGSRVPRFSPHSWSDGYDRPVVMDDIEGTVVRTKVTSSGADVVHFLRQVQECLRDEVHGHMVGIDTEWRHNNRPGEPRYRVAVLQLCVGELCLVFQIHHADYVPDELKDFLANPEFCFAGVAVGGDVERLHEDCNLHVADTVDLPKEAAEVLGRKDLKQSGLKTLAREVMGMSIDKPKRVTMSNWAARHLSPQQVRYACIDAFVSYDVGRRLRLQKNAKLACNPEQPSTGSN